MTTTRRTADTGAQLPVQPEVLPAVVEHGHSIATNVTAAPEIGNFDDLDLDPDGGILPLLPINRKVGQDDSGILVGNERRLALDFVWAGRSTSRAHFPARYDQDPNARPDCWSSSGQIPDPTVTQPRSDKCAACPYSFEATGGNAGPDGTPGCSKNLEALVYLDDGTMSRVARIRFGGIAYKAARNYWDSFKWGRPKKYAVQFLTRMTLESVKTDNGNFLAPTFERVAELNPEEAASVAADARQVMGAFTTLVGEEIVEGVARDADHDNDSGDPFPPTAADGSPVDADTGEVHRPVHNTPTGGWAPSEEPF